VAIKHFARYLRVAGLIGADQAEMRQAVEKQEAAESGEQQHVSASAIRHAAWLRAAEIDGLPMDKRGDGFCEVVVGM
jgi:hypothetical protein